MTVLPDKYAFLLTTPLWYKIRLLIGFSGLVCSGYGLARLFWAHPLATFPFIFFYAYLIVFLSIATWIGFSYRPFDRVKHWRYKRNFLNSPERPSVDIFLPVCGEPLSTIESTWRAVQNLAYSNYRVYVLDDGHSQKVRELATQYGFTYLARENRGHLKKAGNIRHAFARTDSEYFTIFDADFAPRSDYLNELLPYLVRNPQIAIVQSPQAFDYPETTNRTAPLAYAAHLIQEDFYRRTEVGLDTHNATVCVGSNAVYRRSVLQKVGGSAPIEHSEDLHTGFAMVKAGYKVKYIPLLLAFGGVPGDLGSWVRQQIRWCQGSLALVPTLDFWRAKINPATKIAYTSGFLYYYSSFITLLTPYLTYVVLYLRIPLAPNIIWFYLPVIVTNWIFFPRFRTKPFRFSLLYVYWLLNYIHVLTILQHLTKTTAQWIPTASSKTNKSEQRKVLDLVSFNLAVHLGLIGPLLLQRRVDFSRPISWLVFGWLILEVIKPVLILAYSWLRIEKIIAKSLFENAFSRRNQEFGLSVILGILLSLSVALG